MPDQNSPPPAGPTPDPIDSPKLEENTRTLTKAFLSGRTPGARRKNLSQALGKIKAAQTR